MRRILFLDLENCTGCKACMVACSAAKERISGLSKSRIWVPRRRAGGRPLKDVSKLSQLVL